MTTYTISEVAKALGVTIYTLRYYDKEGLMPSVERKANGTRVFKQSDIDALKVIQCLKTTGMPIKEIKDFIDWCGQGDATLQQRHDLFIERKKSVEKQLQALQQTIEVINHKCQYYKTALHAGTENVHKKNKLASFH